MLSAISNDADSVRWVEFCRTYDPSMRAFLRSRYPSVDADDAIQETLSALAKVLPRYRYTPDEKGHFRNYLIGILQHKAEDLLRRSTRLSDLRSKLLAETDNGLRLGVAAGAASASGSCRIPAHEDYAPKDDESWKASAMEAAVEQLMCDARINPATREIFRHVALMHERPEDVAAQFGTTRNNVNQIKNRMIGKLTAMINAMTAL